MLTKHEEEQINAFHEDVKSGRPADALGMLGLLLHQPHIEIYKALDPAAIHQAIHDHAERFSGGRVGGRLHKAVIELILDTGDEKLIAAIDPQWIKNIENDWTPRLRRVPMSRMPV